MSKFNYIVMLLSACFGSHQIFAQLSGPLPLPGFVDSVESFSSSANGKTFLWTFESTPLDFSLSSMPSVSNVLSGAPLNVPVYLTLDNDSGQWYSFVTNYNSAKITRLDYGSSPQNVPSTTNLGVFGADTKLEGIDIVRDINGHWFGFAVNGTQLIKWEFSGNHLNGNIVNVVTTSFPGFLAWPHQINIKLFDKGYTGFVANRNGAITRLDFGTSLNNTPTLTNLPLVNYSSPCNYVLYNQNDAWYMITSNLLTGTLSRIEFGSDIRNDTPTIMNIGNLGGWLSIPRGIVLYPNCNANQLIGYIINEDGTLFMLDFHNDITDTPDITRLGTMSNKFNALLSYANDHSIKLLSPSVNASLIKRINLITIPQPDSINYFEPEMTHIYTNPGTYTAAVYTDPGGPLGATAACTEFDINATDGTSVADVKNERGAGNWLLQNMPNPFVDKTVIKYHLNEVGKSASIVVYDLTGEVVAQFPLKHYGDSVITLSKNGLSTGIYFYSLVVDGFKIATKKMILTN